MGARVPCLLLLALIVGSAACTNARYVSDGKQESALSSSKDGKPPKPMDKPECACKPKDPDCICIPVDKPDKEPIVCEGNPMMAPSNATFACGTTSSPGDVCEATCDPGFRGAPSSTCGDDGQWGAVNGTCEPTVCEGNPPSPNNATFACGTTSSPGDVCEATCDPGFSGAPSSTCGDDGQWGAVNGTCKQGLPSVLVAGAPGEPDWNIDVQDLLAATGDFSQVDVFDATFGTPSVAELQAYDAVLVFSDRFFNDAVALGDNLADYRDAGGRVVEAVFAVASIPLQGRWASGGYQLINPAGQPAPQETAPLIINEPASPLVDSVTSLTAVSGFQSDGGVINGGVVVASWGSGAPLIVRGEKDGRNLVALNFYPPSSRARSDFWDIATDGVAILRNALLF